MSLFRRLFGKAQRERGAQTEKTIKDLLIARAPPWDRVPKRVIEEIVTSITDKGLLEAFVLQSMNAGLVAKYEAVDDDDGPTIRARISYFLCLVGNRAVPALADAIQAGRKDEGIKALALAGDTFEAAIALSPNQTIAYVGLAQIYSLCGKTAEAQKWAERGLVELEKTRATPAGQAIRYSNVFPADMDDQLERLLRGYLNGRRETDPFQLKVRQAIKLNWKKTAEVSFDGEEAPFTKRSVRFTRGKEEAVLWHRDAKITLVRLNVPFEFDDFVELDEFITTHPREEDIDDATAETRYSHEIELFFTRHRCSDEMMRIQATDYEFLVAFAKLRKAAFAAGEESLLVAAYVLHAVDQFYDKDRKRTIRWLNSQADEYTRTRKPFE